MEVFLAFILLIGLTLMSDRRLANLFAKPWDEWVLDGVGLFFQFILIYLLKITLVYEFIIRFFPSFNNA